MKLSEVDVVSDVVSIPICPPCGVDSIAQIAVLEDNTCIWAPGPTQVSRSLASNARDLGLVEDVESRAVVRLASAGCNESGPN